MKFTSPVYSQASGSVAGLTYSRNRGGLYTRGRVIPSNPQTAAQQAARTAASVVATLWGALTPVQRAGWELYAQSVPLVDRLGAQIQVSGMNMFVRSNVPRLVATLGTVSDAPDILNLGETPILDTPTADASTGNVTVNANIDGAGAESNALLSVGRPVPLSRTPAHEPTHFVGFEAFAAGTAALDFDAFFPIAVGQQVRLWVRVTKADGRLSPWAWVDTPVVA